MGEASQSPPVSPYRRETSPNIAPGGQATCELCGRHLRCYDEHGLVACEHCHTELLPGDGVMSSFW